MNKKTCVVAGGAGFIGSHLVDALLEKGYRVYIFDSLITGAEKNIAHLSSNQSCTFIRHDIIKELPIIGPVDYVYHLASPASVPDYQNNPEETALANSVGTRNLLTFAKAYHSKFLFTSTSEVYGDPKEHPQKETYWGNVNPNGERSCYDESKRFGEMMVMLYVRQHGVDARIARIFNTYGPRMRPTDGRVISNFITQALSNSPMTVYGSGAQTRSFCYVSDLVSGLIALMEQDNTCGEVVNLGNPEEHSMQEMAEMIRTMTKSSSPFLMKPLPVDDPLKRKPDISKAERLLSWRPTVLLADGLAKTIDYYQHG